MALFAISVALISASRISKSNDKNIQKSENNYNDEYQGKSLYFFSFSYDRQLNPIILKKNERHLLRAVDRYAKEKKIMKNLFGKIILVSEMPLFYRYLHM